jgi:hypothetical protein
MLGGEGMFGRAPGDGTFGAPLGGVGGRPGRGKSLGAPGASPPGGDGGAG